VSPRQPFVDLAAQHAELWPEIGRELEAIFATGRFIGGERVERFEAEFAQFCGRAHAIGLSSGTDALRLALIATGVGPGDEVITVPTSFVATAEAIGQCGARPVFVDVRPDTLTMDPIGLDAVRTAKTRAVMPVHLYGRMTDMPEIAAWCARTGVTLIEDAAQSHGARLAGRTPGGFGVAAAFSFYPAKNLGAAGDAGALVTDDDEVARRVRLYSDHGQTERYVHHVEGSTSRLDAVQAAVLSIKLRRLARGNDRRRDLVGLYRERLAKVSAVELLAEPESPEAHVHHLFVVRARERDALRAALSEQGIETGLHYPVPIHLQPCYRRLGYGPGSFPVAEAAAREILSLPLYPEMGEAAVRRVADAIAAFFDR
jgi:dTDP-4-amino-4,6-dideoxygalactose transaminase